MLVHPPYFQCNVAIPVLPAGRQKLYFLPDRILVWAANGVGAVGFDQLDVNSSEQRFIESDGVPRDTRVVDKTWRYVNKKGGPDRRFNDNREIPIVIYEAIFLSSRTGLQELFQASKTGLGSSFHFAVKKMASAISQREELKAEEGIDAHLGVDQAAQEQYRQPVSDPVSPIVFAVQSAVMELIELVQSLSEVKTEQEALRQEVEGTVLKFVAAILLADGEYRDGEKDFIALFVDSKALPGGEYRYLNEYVAKWAETGTQVPNFFEAAVRYGSANKTGMARAILRNIQLIGNNVCASDGRCGALEREIVQQYVVLLENAIEQSKFC